MTWPTFAYIFEAETFWLPTWRNDIYMLLWDAWYSQQILTAGADYFFTDLLFHPHGVSLAYHNFSLPQMFLLGALQGLLPASNAFNLSYLILVAIACACAYLYLHYLFRDRWLCLIGIVVFGTSCFVLSRPATPHVAFIATFPLSLYCFHRGVVEERWRFCLLAGLFAGCTAWVGLYQFVCLLITLALYILAFARGRWREPAYWRAVVALLLIAGAIGWLRVYPMLADEAGLAGALAKGAGGESGEDLLAYFVNYENPFTRPILSRVFDSWSIEPGWRQTVYLGYVPMLLIGFGLASSRWRRALLPWLLLALPFLILRLGVVLTVNDIAYESIRLPKHYLSQLLPQVFGAFWNTDPFHAGAMLPWCVAACHGARALLSRFSARRRAAIVLALVGLVAIENYQAPDPLVIPPEHLAYIQWLRAEDDQDKIRLINVPMQSHLSKVYGFHQTYMGYPHAQGRPTRSPPAAYEYIESNYILSAWRDLQSAHCLGRNRSDFEGALEQLLADGFSHIVVHHRFGYFLRASLPGFAGVEPAYSDDFSSIYRLADMRASCANPALPPALRRLALGPEIEPDASVALWHLGADAVPDDAAFALYDSVFAGWQRFVHLQPAAGELALWSGGERLTSDDASAARAQLLWLVHDPARVGADALRMAQELALQNRKFCARPLDMADAIADIYVSRDFPCALIAAEAPFQVEYAAGLQIANLHLGQEAASLSLEIWWRGIPREPHSVSIQLFDEGGGRAHSVDQVIGREALARYQLELDSLPPGEYRVQLIVYGYESGKSLGGLALASGQRFERDLEIASITLD